MLPNRLLFAQGVVHQEPEPFPFHPVPLHRDRQPEHREANPRLPQIHLERVEPAFGDLYGVCSCAARSLPMVVQADAERWTCPVGEAEAETQRNQRAWEQRVLDASIFGAVR